MAYKQQPKSPMLKALKGNQGKLPQHLQDAIKAAPESPAKQVTAGEFAHKKSLKDKEMGKSTKVVDKLTSALEAPFSDKTYSELKKEKRAKQKAKYDAKSPAKKKKTARQLEAEKKAKMKANGKKYLPPSIKRDKQTGESPAKNYKKGYYGV